LPGQEEPIRLDVDRLSYAAGFTQLLHEIRFSVRRGEAVGILGPSGAGKSTLLGCVSGSRGGYDGSVKLDGLELSEHRRELERKIGVVPQDDIVHASLTPSQELGFAARLRMPGSGEEVWDRRVAEVLWQLELSGAADTRIRRLSGGQRKRVSIGVELLTGPPALFLDEPTSGLDPALELKAMVMLRTLARQGRCVLVTTHVMESLDELDLALVLVKGRVVFFGPPAEALPHFGARSFADVYRKLSDREPRAWAQAYRESKLHEQYVTRRLAEPLAPQGEVPEAPAPPAAPAPGPPAEADPPAAQAAAREAGSPPADDLDAELAALRQEVES